MMRDYAKSSVWPCADITCMTVPPQVVCYCYTKILDSIYNFQECSFLCVSSNDPFDPFLSQQHHEHGLESHAPSPSSFTQVVNVTFKFYCVLYALNLMIADTIIRKQMNLRLNVIYYVIDK